MARRSSSSRARKSNVIRPGFAGHTEHQEEESSEQHRVVIKVPEESAWDKIKWTVITGTIGAVAGGIGLYMLNKHVLKKDKDKKDDSESNMADARQNLMNAISAQANPYQNPMMAAAYPMAQPMYGAPMAPYGMPTMPAMPAMPASPYMSPAQPQILVLSESAVSRHHDDDDDDDEYEYDD